MSRIASKWIAALPLAALLGSWLAACSSLAPHGAEADQRALIDFNSCARPEYTRDDLRASHTGTVKLGFLVGADGTVRESRIVQSSGHDGLDRAALFALRKCHFRPARKAGQAVQAWTDVTYIWSITDG